MTWIILALIVGAFILTALYLTLKHGHEIEIKLWRLFIKTSKTDDRPKELGDDLPKKSQNQ